LIYALEAFSLAGKIVVMLVYIPIVRQLVLAKKDRFRDWFGSIRIGLS
jgi:hypothetical protein